MHMPRRLPHVGPPPPQMGETPLIRSAHNGHYPTVRFLVEKGADVNSVDMVSAVTPPLPAPPTAVRDIVSKCFESALRL